MTRLHAPWLDDPAAQRICAVLADAGHQAWFVGGCVRNTLIGRPVSDLDLATDALPDRVIALADRAGIKAVPTGIDHGTVTLVIGAATFEVTTFRRDVATDGRHATIAFADNITDDARRRDFTMNALYASAQGEIADPLGGLPDLEGRRVRFIEDADRRIKEDYLRILRFFRFHAWYGDPAQGLDPEGLAAAAANLDGLATLSAERVTSEMLKLLDAPDPAPALAAMTATGALARVLPGAVAQGVAVLVHLERRADVAPAALRRLAMLGGDSSGLRLSRQEARHLERVTATMDLPEMAYRHGYDAACDAALVRAASMVQPLDAETLDALRAASEQVFPLAAADLMPALTGQALGEALKQAEARWIASGFTLTKADLLG